MALGELYHPSGLALETARFFLQVDNPMACNVALGCPNGCSYCYGPLAFKKKDWSHVRYPKENCISLIRKQLEKGLKPDGVFISFATEPFHEGIQDSSTRLMTFLRRQGIRVAVLTKESPGYTEETFIHGITVVSVDRSYQLRHEPNALRIDERIREAFVSKNSSNRVVVSMEPYPVPSIHRQNLEDVLENLAFVDAIIFGKWNYDKRAGTPAAKEFYADTILQLRDWCRTNGIRLHVKSQTLKFVGVKP